jgi:transposase InsO family protein
MMARGEGDDDVQMFSDTFTHDAACQTTALDRLHDIRMHNASCSMLAPMSQEDRSMQQLYGIGFDIAKRAWHASTQARNPLGFTVADRIEQPHLRLQPLQPSAVSGRQGIGFSNDYDSHRLARNGTAKQTGPAVNSVTSAATTTSAISSTNFVAEWVEEEENRGCFPQSHASLHAWCLAMFPAASQTLPQDYRDLAYARSGGFPLEELLTRAHDDTHPGFLCTWKRVIRAMGPRPGRTQASIKDEVKRYCDACIICQKIKPAREKLRINAGTIRGRPFASYAFDVVTLSEADADGCRYILVCVDSFSRAVELFALKQANASEVFQCLNDVLCRWGSPHELRCDNAKAFTSAMTKALLARSGVKMHLTAPYSHQSNGQVENCNRRVMDILRSLVLDDRLGVNTQTKWSLLLPQVRRIIMTRTVLQHGCTPNDIAYMNCPETEASIFEQQAWMPPRPADAPEPYWFTTLAKQHEQLILLCEEKQDALMQKLGSLNLPNAARKLEVGDCALLKMNERPHSKVQAPWAGPYLIISFPDNDDGSQLAYCQHLSNKKVSLLHLNMLKYCDMSLMNKIEDAIPFAAKDSFEYEVAEILSHRPAGPRRMNGKMRPKSDYQFECLWKDIELSDQNPSWEPWGNSSLRSCEAYQLYVSDPAFVQQYGAGF